MRREEKDFLLRSIEEKSYLRDENYEEKLSILKEEEKERIKRIQTLSIEELTSQTKLAIMNDCEAEISWYIDENGPKNEYMLREFQKLKKQALKISKKNIIVSKEDEQDFLEGFSVSELLTLTPEELVNRKIEIIKQERDQKISDLIERTKAEKEKYSGITEDELDEYAGLLAKKLILEDKIELTKEEELSNNNVFHEDILFNFRQSFYDTHSYRITDVEDIPYYLEEIKKSRKKGLSRALKYLSAYGLTMGTLVGAGVYALSEVLLDILIGMAGGVVFIGLISAVYGVEVLKDILHNKKVVERLKETGIYDMLVEKAGLEKEVEEFEISKGMR